MRIRLIWFFGSGAGKPMASQNLAKRIFEPALRAAGLRKVTFPSIKFISRQVGHSSAKLTLDVYAHLMEGAQEEAMRRLEERLRGGYSYRGGLVGIRARSLR